MTSSMHCASYALQVLRRLAVWSVRRGIPPPAHTRVPFAEQPWTPLRELKAGAQMASPAGKKCVPNSSS